MKKFISALTLVAIAQITGCATAPKMEVLGDNTFTTKGKVVYVVDFYKADSDVCQKVEKIATKCYVKKIKEARDISEEDLKAEETAEKAAVIKEIFETGAIARLEEFSSSIESGGSIRGSVLKAVALAAIITGAPGASGMAVGSSSAHDSAASQVSIPRYSITFPDGSNKIVKCAEEDLDATYGYTSHGYCRNQILSILKN
ncbi:MAG: hypothetical protein ACYDHC_01390 [Desulfuromonadaceae bacterium]